MKRFYQLLFVVAALVSGTVYGMEVNIRDADYAGLMTYLRANGYNFSEEQPYEYEANASKVLPDIETFLFANAEQQNDSYVQLCISYLNHCFLSTECKPETIQEMLRARFTGNSAKALFYAPYRQFMVGQLQLDKLYPAIEAICKSKDIDAILGWLSIFDGIDNSCEVMLVDQGLSKVIAPKKGNVIAMSPEEHSLLQKANHLQGRGKAFIDTLREQDQKDKNERQQLRANAEKRKDNIAGQIFNALKPNQEARLDQLLQDELIGDDAPLGEYRDFINAEIQKRINAPRVKAEDRVVLLNTWNAKFVTLPVQVKPEPVIIPVIIIDNKPQQPLNHNQNNNIPNNPSIVFPCVGATFLFNKDGSPLSSKNLDDYPDGYDKDGNKMVWDDSIKKYIFEGQQRSVTEKPEEPKVELPQQPPQQPNQPNVDGQPQQPVPNAPKGIAALFAATAPKLAIAAVVVGICYWGYTKYQDYKAVQSSSAKASADKESSFAKATADREAAAEQNKQSKQRMHKQQPVRKAARKQRAR